MPMFRVTLDLGHPEQAPEAAAIRCLQVHSQLQIVWRVGFSATGIWKKQTIHVTVNDKSFEQRQNNLL